MSFQISVTCIKCGEKGYLSIPNELPTSDINEKLCKIKKTFCCPHCMASMTQQYMTSIVGGNP